MRLRFGSSAPAAAGHHTRFAAHARGAVAPLLAKTRLRLRTTRGAGGKNRPPLRAFALAFAPFRLSASLNGRRGSTGSAAPPSGLLPGRPCANIVGVLRLYITAT